MPFVRLISTADTEKHPDNRATRFSNSLSSDILFFREGRVLSVSVPIIEDPVLTDSNQSVIFNSNITKGQRFANQNVDVIAEISLQNIIDSRITKIFSEITAFPFQASTDLLSEISIIVTDLFGNEHNLIDGERTTAICLEVK